MNETQVQAQFNMLVEQRNAALNAVVNMAGELAVSKAKIEDLTKQLETAAALVADSATIVGAENA